MLESAAAQSAPVEATIRAVIPYLRLNDRVMELDRAQSPSPRSRSSDYAPSFRPYLDRHITTSLIQRGQSRYSSHWPNLARIQARYGVDPAVVMAIYGKETSYGSVTGGFDLLDALAEQARDPETASREGIALHALLQHLGGIDDPSTELASMPRVAKRSAAASRTTGRSRGARDSEAVRKACLTARSSSE